MISQCTGKLHLQVVADIVCPWSFIGKRSLDKALPILAEQGTFITVEWLPFLLNPNLPAAGMDRRAFRSTRFGSWANAVAMDARAIKAGQAVGAAFHYERQSRTSNTLAAHALSRLALLEGGTDLQGRVAEALYAAYFTDGEDVGSATVLRRIASSVGMSTDATSRSKPLQAEVIEMANAARSASPVGVPGYLVEGRLLFGGAQSVGGYVQALAAAALCL